MTTDAFMLSEEEKNDLREAKRTLTEYARMRLKAKLQHPIMLPASDRIVEATMPYTLRPKSGDREKLIAAALEFVIQEFGYTTADGWDVVGVDDIQELIDELKSTVYLE